MGSQERCRRVEAYFAQTQAAYGLPDAPQRLAEMLKTRSLHVEGSNLGERGRVNYLHPRTNIIMRVYLQYQSCLVEALHSYCQGALVS